MNQDEARGGLEALTTRERECLRLVLAGLRAKEIADSLGVSDATAGFRCYAASLLQRLDLDAVRAEGYGFQIEMTYRVHKMGFKVVELPIIFVDRKVGESKMSNDIVLEAMTNVWKLRFSRVPARRPA